MQLDMVVADLAMQASPQNPAPPSPKRARTSVEMGISDLGTFVESDEEGSAP